MAKYIYNTVVPLLISAHAQTTPREMMDRQCLNILSNYIIDDETGEPLG